MKLSKIKKYGLLKTRERKSTNELKHRNFTLILQWLEKCYFYLSQHLEYITLTVISFMHLNVRSPVVGLIWEGLTDVSLSEMCH